MWISNKERLDHILSFSIFQSSQCQSVHTVHITSTFVIVGLLQMHIFSFDSYYISKSPLNFNAGVVCIFYWVLSHGFGRFGNWRKLQHSILQPKKEHSVGFVGTPHYWRNHLTFLLLSCCFVWKIYISMQILDLKFQNWVLHCFKCCISTRLEEGGSGGEGGRRGDLLSQHMLPSQYQMKLDMGVWLSYNCF